MKSTEGFPIWVRIGLWGISSRKSALAWMIVSVLLGAGFFAYGFVNRSYYIGTLFLLSAAWYWFSIRWVDKNARWEK